MCTLGEKIFIFEQHLNKKIKLSLSENPQINGEINRFNTENMILLDKKKTKAYLNEDLKVDFKISVYENDIENDVTLD